MAETFIATLPRLEFGREELNVAWVLIFIFIGALLGCFVWAWRVWQARFAGRSMDYDSREFAFLAEAKIGTTNPAAARAGTSPEVLPIASPAIPAILAAQAGHPQQAPQPKTSGRPAPLLDDAARLVYSNLKRCAGDYPVLVSVDVARLMNDEQTIPPRVQVDLLVCRKDFTPVVAIFIDRGSPEPLRERAIQLLKQSRIRVLRWDASNPPDAEAMRLQVFKPKSGGES